MLNSEKIFCPHVKVIDHAYVDGKDHYKVKCLYDVCPFSRVDEIICMSHNNGLHIIAGGGD